MDLGLKIKKTNVGLIPVLVFWVSNPKSIFFQNHYPRDTQLPLFFTVTLQAHKT